MSSTGESGAASNTNEASSSSVGGGGNASAPSPGKGGKFLELMQKRLQAEQTQPQAMDVDPPSQQPNAPTTVGDPNASSQPSAVAAAPPSDSTAPSQPPSKPKGKDFASMSARGPRVSPTALTQPALAAPQPPVQPPMAGAVSGKPKGKDFSVMASRMTTDPGAAQVARAAQMQAEARAAAGLPPLSKPTATTVTTTLPNIPIPSRTTQPNQMPPQAQQRHPSQQQPRPISGGYSGSIPPQPQHYPVQQQTPLASVQYPPGGHAAPPPDPLRMPSSGSHNSNIPPPSLSSSSNDPRSSRPTAASPGATQPAATRRPSKTATTSTKVKAPSRPTPTPTVIEGKVSLPPPAVQPYMAPLVGQRIQDLLSSLDPAYTLDAPAQEQVLQLADDFLDKVCKQSLRVAAHRGSGIVEVQDVQLVLMKQWGITIPGLGPLVLNKAPILPSAAAKTASSHGSSGGGTSKRKASTSLSKSGGSPQPKTSSSNPSGNEGASMNS